jgi:hypothetical protein
VFARQGSLRATPSLLLRVNSGGEAISKGDSNSTKSPPLAREAGLCFGNDGFILVHFQQMARGRNQPLDQIILHFRAVDMDPCVRIVIRPVTHGLLSPLDTVRPCLFAPSVNYLPQRLASQPCLLKLIKGAQTQFPRTNLPTAIDATALEPRNYQGAPGL